MSLFSLVKTSLDNTRPLVDFRAPKTAQSSVQSTPKELSRPSAVASYIKNKTLVPQASTLVKDVVQGTARSAASLGQMVSQSLPGGTDEFKTPTIPIFKQVSQALFGKEPVPSLSKRVAEGEQTAKKAGLGRASLPASIAVIGGLTALDFTPLGGGSKVAKQKAAQYVAEYAEKQTLAKGVKNGGFVDKAKDFFSTAKSKLVDSNAPIEDLLSKTLKANKIELKPSEHISNQIDRVLRAPTIAGQFAKDNGLEKVIKSVPDLNTLDQYLIAKHAKNVSAQGIETGRDLAKDKTILEAFGQEYEPFAKQVTQYSQKLLDYITDSGLISKDLAAKLKETYPDYVPLNRIFDEIDNPAIKYGAKGPASLSRQNVVQALEGSKREIESPITSILSKTNDAFLQGEKNKAAKLLAGYEKLPGNPFQLRELPKGETATHTISYIENGVKRVFETTQEIATAAKSLDVQRLNILGKILAFPVRIARLGITGINIPFVASNIAKDQVAAFINSNKALQTSVANPRAFTEALFNAVGHGKLYREMVALGGGGTSFDIARNQAVQTVERIRAGRSLGSKIKYTVTHPSELLRAAEDIVARSEELTRLQLYGGTKSALIKQGMDSKEAIIAAAKASREGTVNFARRGEWGTVLNSAFLYLNAGIQGTRTLVRNLKDRPLQTATKIAVSVFMPVSMATAWNLSDSKRREAYSDIAEYEKENNIIIIPSNPTKDENGKWNVIKIPLSQEINSIAGVPRKALEKAYGHDSVKFGDIARALIGSVSPIDPTKGALLSGLTPQAIKPTIEMATNKNLFTGFKQVPTSLEKVSPEKQVKESTSGTAIKLGEAAGYSPIKIEEFIKGTVGGVGQQALNLSDRVLAGLDLIPEDQVGGKGIIDSIIYRFSKATGGTLSQESDNNLKKILTSQADERMRLSQEAELLNDELSKLPKEEANTRAIEIKKTNPQLFESLKSIIEEKRLGLTYNDRLIKQLGVENGVRAKFIWEELKGFATKDEKNAYVAELRRKKIISDTVFKQLKELAKEN